MTLDIKNLGELIVFVGSVVGALGVIGAFIHFAVVRPMGRALDKRIKEVTSHLDTHNGKSIGEYIEAMATDVKALKTEIQTVNTVSLRNTALVGELQLAHERHLKEDHNG